MGKVDDFRRSLRALDEGEWDRFLTEGSGLPGPRANLELAVAVADEAPAALIHRYVEDDDEYLALCGAIGLGRLVVEGNSSAEAGLRALAEDPRWRVREGVAMGLQRVGDTDPRRLLAICRRWLEDGSWLVQRAVVAGLCEPRLLDDPASWRRFSTSSTKSPGNWPWRRPTSGPTVIFGRCAKGWDIAGASPLPPFLLRGSTDSSAGPPSMIETWAGWSGRTWERRECAVPTPSVGTDWRPGSTRGETASP